MPIPKITTRLYACYSKPIKFFGWFTRQRSNKATARLCWSAVAKEYYKEGITKEDIELINIFFLDYQDLLTYVHTKDKREEASYSSRYNFDKDKVEELRLKTIDFINKARRILDSILSQK